MKMKPGTGLAWALAALAMAAAPLPASAQDGQVSPQIAALAKSLKPQHGKVAIPAAQATLDLGDAYDFYGGEDAKTVLVTIWGNPPDSAIGLLGIVMPAGKSPLSDAWGAVITFEDSGYVSDDDAAEVDYGDILGKLREAEPENNQQRKAAGYPEMHLVGWAEQPHYDKGTHSVVWARDLKIDGAKEDSLNYDVRTLGRKGVLSLNLLSSMSHLAEVRSAAQTFASHASFDAGARYADFDSSVDKKAEYGIGGLIAAGVGVAVAKKLGLLAILLKFLKPLLIAIAAGFAVLRKKIGGLFGRDKDPLEG